MTFLRVVNLLPTDVIPCQGGSRPLHASRKTRGEIAPSKRNRCECRFLVGRGTGVHFAVHAKKGCVRQENFEGPTCPKHWTRYCVIHEIGREAETTGNHESLESWQKIILKYFSSPFFPTPFPKLTFFFHISSSTLYFNIKLYIKLHQPPYGIFLYSSPSPAEHRNSVEKILGRWRETESEGKKVAWKPQRGNDLGPTIEEGGEVDTARCAAVSRWRRRERRLAGFRGCTVGTSPSPCIPIDR